jgi:hypothetical protein
MGVVNLDDRRTWPSGVLQWATEHAKRIDVAAGEYTSDLPGVLLEHEPELRALLEGQKLLAFHCTRLLDYEAIWIREEGLRRLTPDLVDRRIDGAFERGYISEEERERLRVNTVFALNEERHREGQVCLVIGRDAFDDEIRGCQPLLLSWGGEAIYWGARQDRAAPRLGRPAIVVVRVDPSVDRETLRTFPGLGNLFVGALVGSERLFADGFFRRDISAAEVVGIWRPGDAEYDRHSQLPR